MLSRDMEYKKIHIKLLQMTNRLHSINRALDTTGGKKGY